MRKRAQRRSQEFEEKRYIYQPEKPVFEKKPFKFNKRWWVAVTLIGIFFLVLFMNTYYNLTSDVAINPEAKGFDKFYLSGPDPYYNLRLIKETYQTGAYPYYYENDPLLNYPLGRTGSRAPLFNMMALGFSRVLAPFMPETEAIGILCSLYQLFLEHFLYLLFILSEKSFLTGKLVLLQHFCLL